MNTQNTILNDEIINNIENIENIENNIEANIEDDEDDEDEDVEDDDNDNKYDETHNYCTPDKCKYNPKPNHNLTNTVNDIVNTPENTSICVANFCTSCGINIGDCNPRQYCRKTYCPKELYG